MSVVMWRAVALAAASGLAAGAAAASERDWVTSQREFELCQARGGVVTNDAGRGWSPQLYCVTSEKTAQCRARDGEDARYDYRTDRCERASER